MFCDDETANNLCLPSTDFPAILVAVIARGWGALLWGYVMSDQKDTEYGWVVTIPLVMLGLPWWGCLLFKWIPVGRWWSLGVFLNAIVVYCVACVVIGCAIDWVCKEKQL